MPAHANVGVHIYSREMGRGYTWAPIRHPFNSKSVFVLFAYVRSSTVMSMKTSNLLHAKAYNCSAL